MSEIHTVQCGSRRASVEIVHECWDHVENCRIPEHTLCLFAKEKKYPVQSQVHSIRADDFAKNARYVRCKGSHTRSPGQSGDCI